MPPDPFHIVLIEPEIPPNTGNVARLCAATGTVLHLVGKLGFSISDKHLKRAGLDYWSEVTLYRWRRFDDLLAAFPGRQVWLTSKRAGTGFTSGKYEPGALLVFGKETEGLSAEILATPGCRQIRIPIFSPAVRSLNLSTATGIVLYEALRQTGQLDQPAP